MIHKWLRTYWHRLNPFETEAKNLKVQAYELALTKPFKSWLKVEEAPPNN